MILRRFVECRRLAINLAVCYNGDVTPEDLATATFPRGSELQRRAYAGMIRFAASKVRLAHGRANDSRECLWTWRGLTAKTREVWRA